MGFSLQRVRFDGDAQVDADRAGIATWLEERGLSLERRPDGLCRFLGSDGNPLELDGRERDLHLDPLDGAEPVGGGIWHAGLGQEECSVLHDLCIAGRMLVVNPQGPETVIVPGGTHRPKGLPGWCEQGGVAWVDGPQALRRAVLGGFESFEAYREQVLAEVHQKYAAVLRRLRTTDAPAVHRAFASADDMSRHGDVTTPEDADRYVAHLLEPDSSHEAWATAEDDELLGLVCVTVDEANRSGWS